MKKPAALILSLCFILLLAACQTPGTTPAGTGDSNAPATAVSPDVKSHTTPMPGQTTRTSSDNRAWRNFIYIPIQATGETTMKQGDCKTTYTGVVAQGIRDREFKAWVDGEIESFAQGVLKDEGNIQRTRQIFKDKGLDKIYPGSTFIRRVTVQAFTAGGVLSLLATDYTVFKPTDADILKNQLGWDDGTGGYRYCYEWGHITSDSDGGIKHAEAYTYEIKTRCLNLIERKPMQLSDLLRGEEGLKKLNLAIAREISDMNLEDEETLKRPFTGLPPDYDCFSLQNYGPGNLYLSVGFNEGNPFFNLEGQNWFGSSRQIGIDLSGQGAMLDPILHDDTLLPALDKLQAYESMYGAAQGKKYMPDLGLAEYAISNGNKQVRVTRLADMTTREKINAQIGEFEKKYLSDAYIMNSLFFPEAQESPGAPGPWGNNVNKPAYSATVQETGNILSISYRIALNMRMTSLSLLFDLNSGKRLTGADLLKKDYFSTTEYGKIEQTLVEDQASLMRDGRVMLYITRDVPQEERTWSPRYSAQVCGESYFDWEKWGTLK